MKVGIRAQLHNMRTIFISELTVMDRMFVTGACKESLLRLTISLQVLTPIQMLRCPVIPFPLHDVHSLD